MKTDNRRPIDHDDITLMNARRKEKKRQLAQARKPQRDSEWLALGENMFKWFQENEYAIDIDDYAISHGYPPYTLKKHWANESPILKEYLEKSYHLLKLRHNKYLESQDKLAGILYKERPLYNWELKDYELMMKQKDDENKGNINVTIEAAPDTGLKPAPKKGE